MIRFALLFLVFVTWSLPARSDLPSYYQVGFSNTGFDFSHAIIGRYQDHSIFVIQGDGSSVEIPMVLFKEAPSSVSKAIGKKKAVKKRAGSLEVKYVIGKYDLQSCTKTPEFRSFIRQILLLKDNLGAFEVNASGPQNGDCARQVAQALRKQGIQSEVVVGRLPKGGVVVRAFLGSEKEEVTVAKESPDETPLADVFWVEDEKGRRTSVASDKSGFFALSLKKVKVKPYNLFVRTKNKVFKSKNAVIPSRISLETRKYDVFGDSYFSFKSSYFDSIEQISPPKEFLQEIADQNKKDRLRMLDFYVASGSYSGTGISGSTALLKPLGVAAFFDLTDQLYGEMDLVLPLNLSGGAPNFSLFESTLNYRLFGNHIDQQNFELSAGVGGVYYGASKSESGDVSSILFLGNYLSVVGRINARLPLSDSVLLNAYVGVSPAVAAGAGEASLSPMHGADLSYCVTESSCLKLFYYSNSFQLRFRTLSDLSSEIIRYGAGYRWRF